MTEFMVYFFVFLAIVFLSDKNRTSSRVVMLRSEDVLKAHRRRRR